MDVVRHKCLNYWAKQAEKGEIHEGFYLNCCKVLKDCDEEVLGSTFDWILDDYELKLYYSTVKPFQGREKPLVDMYSY